MIGICRLNLGMLCLCFLSLRPISCLANDPKSEESAVCSSDSQPKAPRRNSLADRQLAWLDPDRTEPAGTMYKTFYSPTIDGEVSYLIYVPPGYEKEQRKRYPVLYWLHGSGGSQKKGGEIVHRADQAIRDGKMPAMIVVLVNGLRGATMYCDTRDGKWPLESVIVNDLIPHIDTVYRTTATRD